MKVLKTAVVALSITLIAGSALAQPMGRQGRGMRCPQRFTELDANKDGQVTLAEFLAVQHPRGSDYAQEMFATKDLNNDGVLTAAEFCPSN
ncbi:EF-hand domain-containing protein [Candidatus Electronema sp. PJ]|uniref:EF-hand domain-containing protein n=1 Tax=Candidatus Electronema sp. PJ TaxID=3401572 RepID=UPI003AA87258